VYFQEAIKETEKNGSADSANSAVKENTVGRKLTAESAETAERNRGFCAVVCGLNRSE
jgi:hypothetical protein